MFVFEAKWLGDFVPSYVYWGGTPFRVMINRRFYYE